MIDLNGSIFYKVQFDISVERTEDDFLWRIISHIKAWLLRKWNQRNETIMSIDGNTWSTFKTGGKIMSNDKKSVEITSVSCECETTTSLPFWACRIVERKAPLSDFAPREWITEVGIEPISDCKASFSCMISYIDKPGFIGQCEKEPYPNIPNVIKNILQDSGLHCTVGNDSICVIAKEIKAGEWLSFYEQLQASNRILPFIFISPEYVKDSTHGKLLIDPTQIAIASGGNAIVYYTTDNAVIDEMNYYCHEKYKCYGGAIRIYYPGLFVDNPSDYYRHRYLGRKLIHEIGQEGIIAMIRRALAQDLLFSERLFRVEDCIAKTEEKQRQQRLYEIKQQHEEEKEQLKKKHKKEESDYFELATAEEEKRLQAESSLAKVQEDLREAKTKNYALSTEIESYRTLAARNAELERVCENRLSTKDYPQSPKDVVNYFDASFSDKMAFSEDATNSLKECRIPLDDLWKALFALATVMDDLYINGSGDIFAECRNKSGIDVRRGEGSETRKNSKLMRQYETEYHGEVIDIEAHITYPKIGQSIHFGFSQKDQKLIVGWCGKHKDNYTTQKIH